MDTNATLPSPSNSQAAADPARGIDLNSLLGWILISGLTIVNIFRASTQALVGDEAFTYHWFLRGSWLDALVHYNANNHVLYTVLAKASISLFGLSELTLRLPALIAGSLYLIAAYRLSAFLFPRLLSFSASLLLLSLNPLVLDFLSCARGYGMATAAFLWGLYFVARYIYGRRPSLIWPGVCCAVSVCANLTLATPVASVFAVVAIHVMRARRARREFIAMLAVFSIICVCILWIPLHGANRGQFYAGMGTVSESFQSLLASYLPASALGSCQWVAVGLLLACGGLVAIKPRNIQNLPIAVLGLSLAALLGGYLVIKLPLPINRTGLFLIPLASLSIAALFDNAPQRGFPGGGKVILGLIISALLFFYVKNFRVDHYSVWWYDAETKHAIGDMKKLIESGRSPRPVALAVTIWQFPSLEYYRLLDPSWFTTRTIQRGCLPSREYFDIPRANAGGTGGGEALRSGPAINSFYLLHGADLPYIDKCGLAVLKRYPASQLVLATGPERDSSFHIDE